MDINQIEAEAKATASKHVANMLQRSHQLEKVEQYIRRESRKKSSVEAMLKQAVQTQLDGVKTGLSQLQSSLEDNVELKQSIVEIESTMSEIPNIADELTNVKEQSIKHSQYAAAMENLKHIVNVPESVEKAREWINEGKLLYAHQSLSDLENSRDDLLFEMHKLSKQSPTDINMLKRYFSDVDKLTDLFGKQLWCVLGRTLNSVRREPQVIVTALRVIEREEYADAIALNRQKETGYLPVRRPKQWRKKAFEVLRSSVLERIEGNQFEDRSENKMWLVRHLEVTRRLVIEDLKVVKTACVPCFPPSYNIMDEFIKMYHESLAKHLQDVISNGLQENEYVTMLNWVHSYKGPEMLGHPELDIDVKNIGPLLEDDSIESLMTEYMNNLRVNYQDWMKNSLASDVKDWHRDVEPEQNGNGIFHTSLPVIIFNMLDQNFQVAETVSQDFLDRVIILSTKQVFSFASWYEEAIYEFKRKYFEDRSSIRFFTFYMIAIANNLLQFNELTNELKSRYIQGYVVGRKIEAEEIFYSTIKAFEKLRTIVLKILQEELFMDLSSHLNELVSRKWLQTGSEIVDTISCTIEDYCHDYKHLRQSNFETLLQSVQAKIASNYVHALLLRKISCKSYDERKQTAEKMCHESTVFQTLFQRLSISHIQKDSPFEVLPCVAEVIKLKDISMLSLEVSGVLRKYPDITLEQLVSLILLRGDMGKGDARQLVTDIMAEVGHQSNKKTLFSDIPSVM